MNKQITFYTFLFLLYPIIANGQVNFRQGFESGDPVPRTSEAPPEERLALHKPLLDEAIREQDTLRQIHGNLYIFYDYLRADDYSGATTYLLEAENLAKLSGNVGWQGWVTHRRGILSVLMKQPRKALAAYQLSAEQCGAAKDSLCLAESLEQIGAMYSRIDSFELSEQYFLQAIPMIERFGGKDQLSATLNNFGLFYSRQEMPEKALPYIERAVEIYQELKKSRATGKAMNNLADVYRRLGKNKEAIRRFKECLDFNEKHGLRENMITNYAGLFVTYDTIKDYRNAYFYLTKHYELKDSLIGARTQERIAQLEAQYEIQQKELELERSRAKLLSTQRSLERTFIGVGLLTFLAVGVWLYWRRKNQRAQRELAENQQNLKLVTRILIEKNTLIKELEFSLSEQEKHEIAFGEGAGEMDNLYNQRILTEADWNNFKIYFEKSYPGYLLRLRKAFPTLSEAEERLFLFIKLKLTRKEASAILGISTDSVKKTRNRLRKRLELEVVDSLEEFVEEF